MAVTYYLFCEETGHGVAVSRDSMGLPIAVCSPYDKVCCFCTGHKNKPLHVSVVDDIEASPPDGPFLAETLTVTYSLCCAETHSGIAVGQDSVSEASDLCEQNSVLGLFCMAHSDKALKVLAEPDMVASWDANLAAELYFEITGKQTPGGWKKLVNKHGNSEQSR